MPDLPAAVQQASRLANRAKREALFRVPPVRRLAKSQHERRLRRHASRLPTLAARDREVIARIRDHDVHVTTLEGLALPGTARVKQQLDRLVEELAARPATSSVLRPPREDLLADLAVWCFGLSDPMLDIVENYLGVPVRYYGADVRREIPDGPNDVRQWHRDIEDHRMLKMLVWLNDVDADGGPFAYIPRTLSADVARTLHYVGGFISDEKLRSIALEDEWRLATGPKWTAVMTDTAQVFHRATPPQARDRYSATYTWTSRHPIKTIRVPWETFTPDQVRRIREGLSARQLACLPRALA